MEMLDSLQKSSKGCQNHEVGHICPRFFSDSFISRPFLLQRFDCTFFGTKLKVVCCFPNTWTLMELYGASEHLNAAHLLHFNELLT